MVNRRRKSPTQVEEISPREQELEDLLRRTEQMLLEARTTARGQMSKSVAWDESESLGIPSQSKRINNLSEREYKDTLCKAYVNMPWIGACIDARVLRLISGTWELVPTIQQETKTGGVIKKNDGIKSDIEELFLYVNDDEDLMQFLYSCALDMMIYGEVYVEIVRGGKGKPNEQPTSLHKIDCQTMTYDLDDKGNILQYKQVLQHQKEPIIFKTDQVMRCWFPHPESTKKALSPIAKLVNSAMLYEQMMDWARSFFKKGARPPFSFEHPGDRRHAEEFLIWLRENFTGKQNAHIPLVTFDGVKMIYAPGGPIDLDFLKGLEWVRQEVLSSMQTPPANIGIIESGNIGGGTGFSQQTSFIHNAVKPLERFLLEKVNYHIIEKGFRTRDWKLVLHYANYLEESEIVNLEEIRIKNGLSTPNEARKEMGKAPYEKFGDTPVLIAREILALPTLDNIQVEHDQTFQAAIDQQKTQTDMVKLQIDKLKNSEVPPATPKGGSSMLPPQQPETNPPKLPNESFAKE